MVVVVVVVVVVVIVVEMPLRDRISIVSIVSAKCYFLQTSTLTLLLLGARHGAQAHSSKQQSRAFKDHGGCLQTV